MLDSVIDRGAPVHANPVLTMSKAFFKWCLERRYVTENPAAPISKQTKEVERERVLVLPELARIWHAAVKMEYPFGPIVRLLILTAQRRDEVAGMTWVEIDAEGATWTIPKERAKNGQEHKVALAPAALAIIEKVPRQGYQLLFSTTGKTAVSGWSRSKDRIDKILNHTQGTIKGVS